MRASDLMDVAGRDVPSADGKCCDRSCQGSVMLNYPEVFMCHISRAFLAATLVLLFACSSNTTPSAGGGSGGDQSATTSSGGVTGNGGVSGGLGGSTGGSSLAAGGRTGDIGTWTDGPGSCPSGMTRVDVSDVADLTDASRAGDLHRRRP